MHLEQLIFVRKKSGLFRPHYLRAICAATAHAFEDDVGSCGQSGAVQLPSQQCGKRATTKRSTCGLAIRLHASVRTGEYTRRPLSLTLPSFRRRIWERDPSTNAVVQAQTLLSTQLHPPASRMSQDGVEVAPLAPLVMAANDLLPFQSASRGAVAMSLTDLSRKTTTTFSWSPLTRTMSQATPKLFSAPWISLQCVQSSISKFTRVWESFGKILI